MYIAFIFQSREPVLQKGWIMRMLSISELSVLDVERPSYELIRKFQREIIMEKLWEGAILGAEVLLDMIYELDKDESEYEERDAWRILILQTQICSASTNMLEAVILEVTCYKFKEYFDPFHEVRFARLKETCR